MSVLESSNTRRRRNNNPSSSSAAPTPYDGDFSQRLYTNSYANRTSSNGDGGQNKSRKGKGVGRFVRRKAHLSKLRNMCAKIGNWRLSTVDMLFIVAAVAKLISFLHSWGSNKSADHRRSNKQPNAPITVKAKAQYPTERSNWTLPKWIVRWRDHKMPFFSPMLYRRGDDDYAYYESNLDDYYYLDPAANHVAQNTQKIKYKGMFRAITYKNIFNDYEEKTKKIHERGYVFVDDAIYGAEIMRYETASALKMSFPFVNENAFLSIQDSAIVGAFDVLDNDGNAPHYINDDADLDVYYSFDDDFVRGTHGMGLFSEYKEGDSHVDDLYSENKEGDPHVDDLYSENNEGDSDEEDEWHEKEGARKKSNPLDGRGFDFWHSTEGVGETVCTRPIFYRGNHPNCNELHSQASGYTWLIGEEVYSRRWKNRKQLSKERALVSKFLGAGYFRHAFLLERVVARDHNTGTNVEGLQNQWDDVVFKIMQQLEYEGSGEPAFAEDDEVRSRRWGYDPKDKYTYLGLVEYMRIDSNVMELLTSTPRAANIFSYCGTSSITEYAPIDIDDYVYPTSGHTPKKLRHKPDEYPYVELPLNNHISPEDKLEIALEMAKCLAAMHGYSDGPIVNVDVQLGQFFRYVVFPSPFVSRHSLYLRCSHTFCIS